MHAAHFKNLWMISELFFTTIVRCNATPTHIDCTQHFSQLNYFKICIIPIYLSLSLDAFLKTANCHYELHYKSANLFVFCFHAESHPLYLHIRRQREEKYAQLKSHFTEI